MSCWKNSKKPISLNYQDVLERKPSVVVIALGFAI